MKKVIPLFKEQAQDDVAETLLEAADHNFDEIVVIGVKDGHYSFLRSGVTAADWIRNLEITKLYLFREFMPEI